jgi:hypothetical protein
MAVSASALGAHVIRALGDMLLRGPLRMRKAGAELRGDAETLREKLKLELLYSEDAENQVLEDDRARRWLAELRQVLYRADDRLLLAYGPDAQDQRTSISLPLPVSEPDDLHACVWLSLFWILYVCALSWVVTF